MKKLDQFDPYGFCIQTERVVMDGTTYFKATAQEFPHLEVYEETPATAYQVIVQSIEDLHAAAVADKRPFPTPNQTADELDCSGRITLRMPKPLHRRLLNQARRNGAPLNTEIVTQLSETSAMHELTHKIIEKISTSQGLVAVRPRPARAIFQAGAHSEIADMHWNMADLKVPPREIFHVTHGSGAASKFLSDDPTFHEEMAVELVMPFLSVQS